MGCMAAVVRGPPAAAVQGKCMEDRLVMEGGYTGSMWGWS